MQDASKDELVAPAQARNKTAFSRLSSSSRVLAGDSPPSITTRIDMKQALNLAFPSLALAATILLPSPALATGLATCDSGPQAARQPQAKLEKQLLEQKWQVRRIKVDGGCYEVYALNDKGERVEAYFHPVTLAPVPTRR